MSVTDSVNLRVFEIIDEIVAVSKSNFNNGSGIYVTFSLVMSNLLSRFSISSIEELNINVAEVPTLRYLLSIHQQIQAAVECYALTNIILVMKDAEKYVCGHLRSYNFHSIEAIRPHSTLSRTTSFLKQGKNHNITVDPNAIDLDDEMIAVETPATEVSSINDEQIKLSKKLAPPTIFEDFGIGNLVAHPFLQRYFPCYKLSTTIGNDKCPSTQDCLASLLSFLSNKCNASKPAGYEEFVIHLCEQYDVTNLQEIGVYIDAQRFDKLKTQLIDAANLATERQSHVVNTFVQQQVASSQSHQETEHSSKRPEKKIFLQSLSLKPPAAESKIAQLYHNLSQHFSAQSAFSPSVSAIRTFLETNDVSSVSSAKKRKRKQQDCSNDTPETSPLYVDIAAEYFFLHLGSQRDVSKRYVLVENSALPDVEKQQSGDVDNQSGNAVDLSFVEKEIVEHKDRNYSDAEKNSEIIAHADGEARIPFESKRFLNRTIPRSVADEVASLILDISNEQLRPILNDLQIPPFPPSQQIPSSSSALFSPTTQDLVVSHQVGRIGECLVYHYLKHRFQQHISSSSQSVLYQVQWLNETEDHRAPYDVTIDPAQSVGGGRIFVEVKSSRYDENNVFQLSLWEWQFLTQQPSVHYHIYRVYSVQDRSKTRMVVLTNVRRLVEIGRVQLCLSI